MTAGTGEGGWLATLAFLLAALAGLGATGCGIHRGADGTTGGGAGEARDQTAIRSGGETFATDTVQLHIVGEDAPATSSPSEFRLLLRNRGSDTLHLSFPDGQRFDFVVKDRNGETVWRWSEGRFFTQATGSEELAPGDSLAYSARLEEGLESGRYTVVGEVTTRGRSLADTARLVVDGAP